MAINIIEPKKSRRESPDPCECKIMVDTEDEILAFGDVVDDGKNAVIPQPNSLAYTAGYGVIYHLSNSRVWVKVE